MIQEEGYDNEELHSDVCNCTPMQQVMQIQWYRHEPAGADIWQKIKQKAVLHQR